MARLPRSRAPVRILLLALLALARSSAADIASPQDAERVVAEAFAALAESDADRTRTDRLVQAALGFAQALEWYRGRKQTDDVNAMQANVYWCRKRMDMDTMQAFARARNDAGTKALVARVEAVASEVVPASQAEEYFARAERFAKDNPKQPLQIAIRYFEVADRFAGTPVSLKAQRLSLDAQKSAVAAAPAARGAGGATPVDDRIGRDLNAQIPVPGDLPASATRILTEHNEAVSALTRKASESADKELQKLRTALAEAAAAEEKKGNLDAVVAIRRQLAAPEGAGDGLTQNARYHVDAYQKARAALVTGVEEDIHQERVKAARALERAQETETRNGNANGGLAIKARREALLKTIDAVFSDWLKYDWRRKSDGALITFEAEGKDALSGRVSTSNGHSGQWQREGYAINVLWKNPMPRHENEPIPRSYRWMQETRRLREAQGFEILLPEARAKK